MARPRLNRENEPGLAAFAVWSETKLNYPREVYNDEYYRLVHGQEEHYGLLRSGWMDEKPEDHPYAPWTSSPEMLELARKGIERLKAQKDAEDAAQTPKVTTDLVSAMIEKQLAERMAKA